MSAEAQTKFEGHEGRECGEHRTLGGRAWCYACSTYCYPNDPCPGCELPQLREALEVIRDHAHSRPAEDVAGDVLEGHGIIRGQTWLDTHPEHR